jgi:nucleotide-binding universal stress UspA family protein
MFYRQEGKTAAEILHIADEEKVDAIVIGSMDMNTVREFLLDGVSYKVIHHAKCSVTLVR